MTRRSSTFVHWSWKNVPAAAPLIFLAASFGRALVAIEPSIRPFARILRVEFLAIHSLPFVVGVALARPQTRWGRAFQVALFGGLMWLYSVAALATGWEGLALFLSLTLATYLGFLLNLREERARVQLIARWLVAFLLLVSIGAIVGLPERMGSWNRSRATLYTGVVYFGILGFLEAIGFYRARSSE